MSEWYEADKDNLDLDLRRREVDIFVTQNYHGSVYVTLTFDQVKDLYNKIMTLENQGQEDK